MRPAAPADLLRLSDLDLLDSLGLIRGAFPNDSYTYVRHKTDTSYDERLDGRDPMSVALWTGYLRPSHLHRRLAGKGHPERDRRLEFGAAKARIHSVLLQRQKRGAGGLTNADIIGRGRGARENPCQQMAARRWMETTAPSGRRMATPGRRTTWMSGTWSLW